MSSFALYTGVLTYGNIGTGAMDAAITVPVYNDESFCDGDVLRRKQFYPQDDDCDGCSTSDDPHAWDLQWFRLFDKDKNYVEVQWSSDDDEYKVTNEDGDGVGTCQWLDPSEDENCNDGLDVYSYAHYMDCEFDIEWSFT